MTWRIKSFMSMHIFLFLLPCCMLFSFLFINNTFATSVDCGDISSSLTYYSRNFYNYSFSSCDTSSLDSSKVWYYSYDFNFSSFISSSWSIGLIGSINSSSSYSYFALGGSGDYSSYFPDGLSGLSSWPVYNWSGNSISRPVGIGWYSSLDPTTVLSYLNISITDSLDSFVDCPVCEECQVCPVIPENPYDDKFDQLIKAIYTCGAILLVLYFFYCIYRMIIKSTGGT